MNFTRKYPSYAIFGGINSTQVVGGDKGVKYIDMLHGDANPSWFWGLPVRGFSYGKTVLMDPSTEKPILGVIDSGTTLVIVPTIAYDNLIYEIA